MELMAIQEQARGEQCSVIQWVAVPYWVALATQNSAWQLSIEKNVDPA